jgi:enoyl-CoA hydratase/carnithine racemase
MTIATSGTRTLILDRPRQLNALTLAQVRYIQPRLRAWDANPDVQAIVVQGAGDRAFCAGGDVVALYRAGLAGNLSEVATFFREEYELNLVTSKLNTAYIALLDGVTMGGGVGLSVHGRYRVATERTVFAMPETGIGFFPDVGGSHFLPRMPGGLGAFLALTGSRLTGADAYHAGVATHFVPSHLLPLLHEELDRMPSVADAIDGVLGTVHSSGELSKPVHRFSLEPHWDAIDRCFGSQRKSVEDVVIALQNEPGEWAKKQLATLRRVSPTALKVTWEQLRRGGSLSLAKCLAMEFRIAQRFTQPGGDFYEGVRALLVDGDKKPRWSPARLEDVTDDAVAEYFAKGSEDDLQFSAPGLQ